MFTPEVVESAKRSVLCWLATADRGGTPNVSPKEIFAPVGERHFAVANIASPRTAGNIAENSAVCLSFINVFVQKGFKIGGTASILARTDPGFEQWARPLLGMAGDRFRILSVIVIVATSVEPIVAPSYRFYPRQTTESSQIEAAMRAYGVRADRSRYGQDA